MCTVCTRVRHRCGAARWLLAAGSAGLAVPRRAAVRMRVFSRETDAKHEERRLCLRIIPHAAWSARCT